jgi:hypothetical protein
MTLLFKRSKIDKKYYRVIITIIANLDNLVLYLVIVMRNLLLVDLKPLDSLFFN